MAALLIDTIKFEADLPRVARYLDIELNKLIRRVAIGLFQKIVRRTPVDTGRARSSWVITKERPSDYVPDANATFSASPRPTIDLRPGDYSVIWIVNNLPYIHVLEFGEYPGGGPKTTAEGYSTQAPQGMVRVSLAEIDAELAVLIR